MATDHFGDAVEWEAFGVVCPVGVRQEIYLVSGRKLKLILQRPAPLLTVIYLPHAADHVISVEFASGAALIFVDVKRYGAQGRSGTQFQLLAIGAVKATRCPGAFSFSSLRSSDNRDLPIPPNRSRRVARSLCGIRDSFNVLAETGSDPPRSHPNARSAIGKVLLCLRYFRVRL